MLMRDEMPQSQQPATPWQPLVAKEERGFLDWLESSCWWVGPRQITGIAHSYMEDGDLPPPSGGI